MHTSEHREETGLVPAGHYFGQLTKSLNERCASRFAFGAAEERKREAGRWRALGGAVRSRRARTDGAK